MIPWGGWSDHLSRDLVSTNPVSLLGWSGQGSNRLQLVDPLTAHLAHPEVTLTGALHLQTNPCRDTSFRSNLFCKTVWFAISTLIVGLAACVPLFHSYRWRDPHDSGTADTGPWERNGPNPRDVTYRNSYNAAVGPLVTVLSTVIVVFIKPQIIKPAENTKFQLLYG